MSHDGNLDRLDAGREYCVGLKMRRACALSNTDLNPVASSGSIRVPTMVQARRRWQCTVCKSFVDCADVVPVASSPSIEITSNHVNLLTNHDGTNCEDDCGFAKCRASHARLDVVTAPDTTVASRQEL